ncbi:sulfotransferase domain-containing protein [Pseudovibrio ascidiaceicola]|uniref:sulfotransferase domain-containing protein n=1 Tax=Pseudovibrio ascidiaceicola TaxID=285279 RepID=UPI003D36F81A
MSFAVFGQHRSGTSFFLDLIRHHPDVDTINEPISMHVEKYRKEISAGVQSEFIENLDYGINSYIEDLHHWLNFSFPNIRGFKETAFFESIPQLQRRLGFKETIVLVRDPRAVINSVTRRQMQNSWWQYRQNLNVVSPELDVSSLSDAGVCAHLWRHRQNCLRSLLKGHTSILIRLEDILLERRKTLELVMSHLNLEVREEQLEFLEETGLKTHDATYSSNREKDDVLHRWKTELRNRDKEEIQEVLREELEEFGYL